MVKQATLLVIACGAAMLLSACGSKPDAEEQISGITGMSGTASVDQNIKSGSAGPDDEVGPQYTQPSMDTLKGIPQKFPAKYTLKRYPHAQMVLAWVRPNLQPGWKNQVMLRSNDPPINIASFYKSDLTKDGWKLVSSYENPIYSSTIWRKDGEETEVRISPDQYNRQNIQLFAGPEPKPRKIATVATN